MSALVQARQSLQQLPPRRQAALAGVVVGAVVVLLLVARWATAPDYALLFGELAAGDAGRVVERLEAENVAYDLRDGGTAVYVPRAEVHRLRLGMATDGVVADGPAGYELFDTGTLGMTDFMQKLNVKRALEGELARTIGSVRQVEGARVHLVLPERSPFRDRQATPSASVVLNTRGALAPDQVAGITALVAGAVEGLDPSEVTVLDQAGRMLASPGAASDGMTSGQIQMRRETEEHLAASGQTLLDQMLGPGRAVVRVAAELDLSRTSTERAAVDPESQTVISEEKQEEVGDGGGASSTVRNFEVTRERTVAEREAGAIQTLTVSVLLDEAAPPVDLARPQEEGPTPFTDEQLRQIEALVKNAVGFQADRGDQFALQQIRFAAEPESGGLLADAGWLEIAGLALRYGVVLLALFLAYRLLRRLADGLAAPADDAPALPAADVPALAADIPAALPGASRQLPQAGPPRATVEAVDGDPFADKLSAEARDRLADAPALVEDVRAHVVDHPEAAAALVRAWLREDAEREALVSDG